LYGEGGFEFWVIHVYGTPYEMGYAHGTMMKPEAQAMINRTMQYLYSQAEQQLQFLPTWLRDWVAEVGLDVALDWTANVTAPFTGDYFFEEMHGLADGAGIDYQDILRVHMIGELTQGDCSMYGAWGSATAATGHTMQLRALDWDTSGPFRDYPAVVVYHPSSLGHAFANVGFVGWIGALTGQSSKQMAISEIGGSAARVCVFVLVLFAACVFVFCVPCLGQQACCCVDVATIMFALGLTHAHVSCVGACVRACVRVCVRRCLLP